MIVHHAGADVSARWFDLCVLCDDKPIHRRFDNSNQGLQQCVQWLSSMKIQTLEIVLEPTGRYGEAVAEFFYRRKYRVRLVQPFKASRFAESLDMRGKSDFKDAYSLAVYSKERGNQLREWMPKTQLECELRDMQLLLRSLTKRKVTLECQLKCRLRSQFVQREMCSELESVCAKLELALDRAEELILADETLASDYALLLTIPGIGRKTAALLLTAVDFRAFRTSRELACFLGLTKKKNESGSTIRGHEGISKRGNKWIRGGMFMPARVARMHNPHLKEFSDRLVAAGKHDWVVQMAVIRKLITTAWAVVVKQQPYSAVHLNPNSTPI